MLLTQRHGIILGSLAVSLLAFWYIDTPSTIRLKTSILKLLPMEPAKLNQSIRSVCAGSYVGLDVVSCYGNFRSEAAEAEVMADQKCARFKETINANSADWLEVNPKPEDTDQRTTYSYKGTDKSMWDKYGLLIFYPDDCSFISINEGDMKKYSFR